MISSNKIRKAKIAVIGTGWWATTAHLPALCARDDVEIAAVCDRRPELLARVADRYGVKKFYTDHAEMLRREQLDGAVISVWNAAHYEVARDCLKNDLHVLIEKPMVLHASQAKHLVDLAQSRNRELLVGYPWHYCELAQKARHALSAGDMGPVRYINCYFASTVIDFFRGDDRPYGDRFPYQVVGPGDTYSDAERSGGGQGQLQVTHAAALLCFITGLRPKYVMALMDSLDVQLDVINAITVRLNNGALATIGSTGNLHVSDPGKLSLQVNCDHGWLDCDFVAGAGVIRRGDALECELRAPRIDARPPGSEQPDSIYPLYAPANNLADLIAGNGENQSSGEIGWRAVEMVEAAYRSAALDGQLVSVESLYS